MGILQPLLSWKESQANGHILYDILHERIIGCNATAFTMLGFGDMVLQRVKQFFLIIKGSLILLHHYQNCIFIAEGAMNAFPRYCYKIPNDYPLASATLLCAGITVYTPMILHKMNQWDKSLGIIGLGGLGHMAVKFGKAFGLHVTVFSSISKKDDALNLLGVDRFVVSSDGRWRGEDISFLFGTSIAALIIGLMLRNSILKGGL